MTIILSELNLRLDAGDVMIIRGANGSGKTTLLRAVAGLMSAEDGTISINDVRVDEDRIHAHQAMIYIGHRDGFTGYLTARENLALWGRGHGYRLAGAQGLIQNALATLGMDHHANTPLYMMSEGQRKRCGLARLALAVQCEDQHSIWVLDEPMTALDQTTITAVEDLIQDHAHKGGIVMMSTHQETSLKMATTLNLDERDDRKGGSHDRMACP